MLLVSERSLWYDGTWHVRPIRNFRIGTSLSNRIRIGTKRRKLLSYDFKAQDKDNFFYKTYLTNTYSPLKYNINFNRNNHIFPGTSTSE